MLPYIEVFSRRIPMYGLMAGLGVLLAVLYVKRAEKRYPALETDAELAFVYGIVGAFVGAKLLFLCTVLPELRADLPYLWTQTAAFLKKYLSAGFVFFGGLYGALAAALLYARLTRTSAEKLLNMLLPAVLLIHGLGRVGCFCMGCCYGKPSEKWGVLFSRSEIAPSDVPLLPIQLYEAAGVLLLFGVLAHMGAKKANGFRMLAVYLLAYSILRFGLEYLRGDAYRGFLLGLSVSQMLSITSVLLAGFLLLRLRGKRACGAA